MFVTPSSLATVIHASISPDVKSEGAKTVNCWFRESPLEIVIAELLGVICHPSGISFESSTLKVSSPLPVLVSKNEKVDVLPGDRCRLL